MKLFFDRAASKTDVPDEYLAVIKACNSVIRFNIPLRRDNGKIETITCYRYTSLQVIFLEPSTAIIDYQLKEEPGTPQI